MDWIDDFVAVGSLLDAERVNELKEEDIDLIVDARVAFERADVINYKPIVPKVLRAADILVALSQTIMPKILIHCTFGVERTPFLAMVYVSRKYSMTYEEAYNYVREKRPQTIFRWDWVEALKNT
jgi:protein-tyrosine phosphatase